jgi:hypothetical protein
MKVSSDRGDFLEVERSGSREDALDLLLVVRLRFRGFAGEIDTWVHRVAWFGFVQDLVILEERRQGEAKIQSISPGELSLVVRSLDPAGHVGVEGSLGVRTFEADAALRFSVLPFDPSQLPPFARAARALCDEP